MLTVAACVKELLRASDLNKMGYEGSLFYEDSYVILRNDNSLCISCALGN